MSYSRGFQGRWLALVVLFANACGGGAATVPDGGGSGGTGGAGAAGRSGGSAGSSGGSAGASSGVAGASGGVAGSSGGSAGASSGVAGASGSAGAAGHAAGGASGGSGGGFVAAAHPALPQVLDLNRAILRTPKVQLIAYSSDSGATDLEAFLQELTKTTYWSDTTSEYGVGPLTILPTIVLTTAPPATMTDTTLRNTLAANTSGANPVWGAADANTIYLFAFPTGSIEESSATEVCCTAYDGYHDQATSGAVTVPYAVSCSCPGLDGSNVTNLQQRTVAISHELVEASTDPFPETDPGYIQEDDADIIWTLVTGGEVADMCEFNDDANYVPPGSTYMIQRIWSNTAAALTQNPCVPHTNTQPYFNSVPALGTVAYPLGGAGFTTQGVNIPIGQTKTIDLDLFSTAATSGPWTVTVYDYDYIIAGTTRPYLTLSLDKNTGQNGDTLHLTITAKTADAQLGGEAFIIFSELGQPGDADFQSNLTMGLVTN